MSLPVAQLAGAAAVFGAGFWLAWTIQGANLSDEKASHQQTIATYQQRLADGLAEAQRIREALQAEKQEALSERDAEIDRLAAAADRIPDTIRVRVPATCPVPAAPDREAGPDGVPEPEAGRVFRGAADGLDIRRLRRLAVEADELNANYRALRRACS